jgi:hypothetical protein
MGALEQTVDRSYIMSESDVSGTPALGGSSTLVIGADSPGTADVAETDEQVVGAFGDAARWLDVAYGAGDEGPCALVCAGEVLRSASAADAGSAGDSGAVSVSAVPEVSSLGRMAADLRTAIEEASTGGRSVGILITDFDAAIEATSVEAAFRFLHVLSAYCRTGSIDATMFVYTRDPLSETAIETLRPLFSTVEYRTE